MEALKIIVTILFAIMCVVLTVIVLMQEGKQGGLSSTITGGSTETYVGKNQGRTPEGRLKRYTKILVALFLLMSIALNILYQH